MVFWGIISIVIGWYLLKWGFGFVSVGFGLLFGKYIEDPVTGKYVKKE